MTRALLASALALLATPALAQTDDLIVNDIIRMLAVHAGYVAMGETCATITGNDPAVTVGFAGYAERSQPWLVTLATMLGSRGGPDAAVLLAEARDREIKFSASLFEYEADKAQRCRDFAERAASSALDISHFLPANAQHILAAQRGEWPEIDLATVPEVQAAMTVWQVYEARSNMIMFCGLNSEDGAMWDEALSTYIDGNYNTSWEAQRILKLWGADAPWRKDSIEALSEIEADLAVNGAPDSAAFCQGILDALGTGAIDLATLEPDAVALVMSAKGP